ncbi:spore coat protein [Prauserella marina]|uniref:Spore coat polysaccharide biosynthesis protein SpsG, predicted glycosyltransferase n=1 Tax=Prauserella marina TaxID=530584 RepID=A0A222VIN8_9PSEU|nr:spore coat protein [Prauserella marina]ASR33788.1 spore coat protein [Prauserella marina]PWV82365.1 spore coat polysaccharide biosynthesis predicted glycosyltransferase SpsG [Prauserella marina]SDC67416.1 Spore coat polysaccharide biosynthesis protein SpsG, predicted glycosyltransferase [Prauserella marina]
MKVVLRADSSRLIGAGHVARMVAVAEEASARGWSVSFAGDTGNAEFLTARLAELAVPVLPPDAPSDGADAVIVDHYGIGELRAEVNATGALLVSFEDGPFGRRAADIVVDCGFDPAPRPDDGSPIVLAGAEFAPLRQVVVAARAERARRAADTSDVPSVLVVLGGGGVWQDTVVELLTALRDTGMPFAAEALVRGEPALPEPAPGQRFVLSEPGDGLLGKLVASDLVVSAAGVTLYELCCVGVPSALVQLVDNQAAGYESAVGNGLAVGLGSAADLRDAAGTLAKLLADPSARYRIASTAAGVVDGKGAGRVLDALAGALR